MQIHIKCFEGYTVSEVLCDYDDFFHQFKYSVISCVDSSDQVASFIFSEGVKGIPLGNSAIVDLSELLRIAKEFYFCGYDEVWFSNTFPVHEIPLTSNEPPYVTDPNQIEHYHSAILVGPNDWILDTFGDNQELPPLEILSDSHLNWFQNSEYVMGMGDREGLLCIYKDPIILPWLSDYEEN